jgi:WXG100 family type VII secretion target
MAGGSFGTSIDVMQKAAQQVNQVSEEINAELRSLLAQIEPVAAGWKGEAASAFQALMARWNEDAQKLTQALQGISESLGSSTRNYSAAEDSNAAQISKISAILGG